MTTPTLAWSEGCHSNKVVDDAYASGGFRAVFAVKGGINDARAAGARTIIDRFPGTMYGEAPHLTQFLRCADDDWAQAVKSLTGFSLFRKRVGYIAYMRGLADLPKDATSITTITRIISILRRAGAKCIIEGSPADEFERAALGFFITAGLYFGTEPYWDRGATTLWQYPCIVEERALPDHKASIDGSIWPSNWRPFGKYAPAPMLILSDRSPVTADRIAQARANHWEPVIYAHQVGTVKVVWA